MSYEHRLFPLAATAPINPDMLPVVYRVVYGALISRGQLRRIPFFQHTYAQCGRVTDGARTRDLVSHNPRTYVAKSCRVLQNRLIYAELFAGGCLPYPGVAS